jgi:hypothetical protein
MKKDGKALRMVHGLEQLNKVTIQHSRVVPIPKHLAEQFGGQSCRGMLDLYVAFNERKVAESSRDLTTFQTPFGALHIITLPMGWTNSVPIMHDDILYILQPEILHVTIPYINDAPIKGPKSQYQLPGGTYEMIPENRTIRWFVWEHFENLNRVVQHMKYFFFFSFFDSTIYNVGLDRSPRAKIQTQVLIYDYFMSAISTKSS